MNHHTLLEIVKVLLPAIVSSSLVAYFFEKRLRRLGSYEEITNKLMERMLNGIEDAFVRARQVNAVILGIEKLISSEDINPERASQLQAKLGDELMQVLDAIAVHRIYITALIPFGASTDYADTHLALCLALELLAKQLQDGRLDEASRLAKQIRELIADSKALYEDLCGNVTAIKKKIMDGDVVV